MSLRIRRGTDTQRQTLTFDQGEVVYTTDTKKVYVGDGITQGGVNILANSAGVGVTFNGTTQAFDFSTNNLGLTTSVISEGSNKYFTTQRAQDAAASLFTSVGSPTSTGTITGTVTSGSITVSIAPANMVQGERIVISGTGGNGLSAGTYYVVSVVTTTITLASSLANAMAGTAISSLTTGSITGTTYAAGGTDTGITFNYDSINHVMNVTASGVTSIVNDTSPSLGGNLSLNSKNITGTGNIGITGTLSASAGLGADLLLNSHNITGTGNINIAGAISLAQNSLGTPLSTSYGLTGGNSSIEEFFVSRGAVASPQAVIVGDTLSGLGFAGYDGTQYTGAATILAGVDPAGTVSNNAVPGILYFATNTTSSSFKIMSFNSAGVLTAPVIQTGLYATGSYPTNPSKGMIIFDSTLNHFYGYNGAAWVAFTGP
jgi:hypothetical protein